MANDDISALPALAGSIKPKMDAVDARRSDLADARRALADTITAQTAIVEKAKGAAAAVIAAEQASVTAAIAAYQMAVDDLTATSTQIEDLVASIKPTDADQAAAASASPAPAAPSQIADAKVG